ncbi:MAG TPA: recombinase family protein [Ktedonobacteraceae bacterium]|nr:recombinase family protein [Ktedonobacteraceae bacterium]
MGIKIVHAAQETEYDLTGIEVDLTRKTGVLIRQSRKKSDKSHYEGRLRQETMVPIAIAIRGDEDDRNIELYDEGAGVSGTKGYDERPKLSRLYIDIANDVVGSLVLARADRLFRDKHFRNVSMFTELAEKKKLKLIVPGRAVYDFTRTKDLQAFQKEMQDAYNYLATQIVYLNETRQQKVQRGLYGGGHLPAPYVIDRNAWKDEQRPIIYHPWQEIAVDLFQRFYDNDFSLAYIVRYIESLPCLFPYPPAEDLQKYNFPTIMSRVEKGFTFASLDALKHYLSNMTLGGYAKIGKDELGNEILLAGAFEAAVPMDLLAPCYGAITGHYPDGTPFDKWKDSRRSRKHTRQWESDAILHGFLKSDDGAVSFSVDNQENKNTKSRYDCHQGSPLYGSNRVGIIQTKTAWTVSCKELDAIVLDRLCDLAQYDGEMADRIKAIWESRQSGMVDEAQVLKTQIEKAQAQIARLDNLLTKPARPLSKQTEARYITQLAEAEIALEGFLEKQQAQSGQEDPERVVPNFYYVLSHLPTEYKKLSSEHQKKMIRKVVKAIKLNMVSSHLFLLHIIWEDGVAARDDVALIWRGTMPNTNEAWSREEEETLFAMYHEAAQVELMQAFPRFSWYRICDHAKENGIYRNRSLTTGRGMANLYHRTVSWQDLEAVARLVEEPAAKERMQEIANTLAKETLRGQLSAHWWLPLDEVSYLSLLDGPDDGGDSGIRLLFPDKSSSIGDGTEATRELLHGETITNASTARSGWRRANSEVNLSACYPSLQLNGGRAHLSLSERLPCCVSRRFSLQPCMKRMHILAAMSVNR